MLKELSLGTKSQLACINFKFSSELYENSEMEAIHASSTNQDSIVFYFNTAFITSTTGTYQWSNNVTGITVGQALADVYGYPGWL
jgi:hypothetical protein